MKPTTSQIAAYRRAVVVLSEAVIETDATVIAKALVEIMGPSADESGDVVPKRMRFEVPSLEASASSPTAAADFVRRLNTAQTEAMNTAIAELAASGVNIERIRIQRKFIGDDEHETLVLDNDPIFEVVTEVRIPTITVSHRRLARWPKEV